MNKLTILAAAVFALAPCWATGATIDPMAVANEASDITYKAKDYPRARGILGKALREAESQGPLTPDFAILYKVYSETARIEGNAAFALQLADQGLSLVLKGEPPNETLKNTFLVDRAYALADLGRYKEAVEAARITAEWLGAAGGQAARDTLEKSAAGWAQRAAEADKTYTLPPVAEFAEMYIAKALEAFNAGDSQTTRELATRALLPETAGASLADIHRLNAESYTLIALAYQEEGRLDLAIALFRRGIDLVTTAPWDGKSKPELNPAVIALTNGPNVIFYLFTDLANAEASRVAGLGRKAMPRDLTLAFAALAAAEEFATRPDSRFSLLIQKAGLADLTEDYASAEKILLDVVAGARGASDEKLAKLGEFYVAGERLNRVRNAARTKIAALAKDPLHANDRPNVPELVQYREAAIAAVEAAGSDVASADYVLSRAIQQAYGLRFKYFDAIPLAARAFEVFKQRQHRLAGKEQSLDSSRREDRVVLEAVMGASYAEEEQQVAASPQ